MKSPLNSAQENYVPESSRLKDAKDRDRSGRVRGSIVVGGLALSLVCGVVVSIINPFSLLPDKEPGSSPDLTSLPSATPAKTAQPKASTTKASTPAKLQMRLHHAQDAIEGGMAEGGISVLPDGSDILHPGSKGELEEIIQDHRNRYSVKFGVSPVEAAGYTDCSLVVHQTRGSEFVNGATVQEAVRNLATRQMAAAGIACHGVLMDGFAGRPGYHRLEGL